MRSASNSFRDGHFVKALIIGPTELQDTKILFGQAPSQNLSTTGQFSGTGRSETSQFIPVGLHQWLRIAHWSLRAIQHDHCIDARGGRALAVLLTLFNVLHVYQPGRRIHDGMQFWMHFLLEIRLGGFIIWWRPLEYVTKSFIFCEFPVAVYGSLAASSVVGLQ